MESIFELRSLLFSVLSSGTCDGDEQELFDELVANEPHLMKIFNFGSRNPQEQKDIDSGMTENDPFFKYHTHSSFRKNHY